MPLINRWAQCKAIVNSYIIIIIISIVLLTTIEFSSQDVFLIICPSHQVLGMKI